MWVLVHPIMLLLHSAAASEYAMHGLKWVAHPEAAAPSCCPPCSPIALLLDFRYLYCSSCLLWCLLDVATYRHVRVAAGVHVPAGGVAV